MKTPDTRTAETKSADKPSADPAQKPEIKPDGKAAAAKRPYLTARSSEAFGPRGGFVDLTEAEAQAAPEDVLTEPTAAQLAQRG